MRFRLDEKHYPLLATFIVCALLYAIGAVSYRNFASPQVFADFFSENAPLGIAAVGLTFVILSGGIDLSVASVMALSTMVFAGMTARVHVHPAIAVLCALAIGTLLGWATGLVVHYFELPPFLVTLSMLFLARGACFLVSMTPIDVSRANALGRAFSAMGITIGDVDIRARGWMLLLVVLAGVLIARFTRFGRGVYALGGNEQAAKLMGLPVGRTKIAVYTLSGFCAALAGVVSMSMISSGDPIKYMGYELDAIAAAVIGGTLLTGGVGYVAGTLLGVLILALIQTLIVFDGRLDSSWTRITIGLLLFAFIALQKLLTKFRPGRSKSPLLPGTGGFPLAPAQA
jgi:ribose/xylose/arabinose/galactoside ABC-type transport system permease subunit